MKENGKTFPKIVAAVVATAANLAIGKNNDLLWHMPADLKHFKSITSGGTIIMGRKTFDSIQKPLPNRQNIIVTRQPGYKIEGASVVHSIEDALQLAAGADEVYIVGGAGIYQAAMKYTNKIYLTTVHHTFDADTFFPALDASEWKTLSNDPHPADEKNPFPYTYTCMERK